MIRIFSILAGLFFTAALAWSFVNGAVAVSPVLAEHGKFVEPTVESEFHKHPKHLSLASDGMFGKFDKQQLQRGFQVYQEVCAQCHSLRHVAYRDLAALGYNEAQIKNIAAKAQIPVYDPGTGEVKSHAGLAKDYFPPVIFTALGTPPDLSLIAKARHGDAAYVYSLLTGYADPATHKNEAGKSLPKENHPGNGLFFNPYFVNLNLAMQPPLSEGLVTYAEGNPKPTVDQMARDVSAFLVWTAEPTLDKRRQTGWPVVLFLLFATVLAYLAYRNVWADEKH